MSSEIQIYDHVVFLEQHGKDEIIKENLKKWIHEYIDRDGKEIIIAGNLLRCIDNNSTYQEVFNEYMLTPKNEKREEAYIEFFLDVMLDSMEKENE